MSRLPSRPIFKVDDLRSDLLAKDAGRRAKRKKLSEVAALDVPARNDLLPRLKLVDRDPRSLVLPKRNVRNRETAHVREVANAISTLGFSVPVVIDDRDRILDGVVRIDAANLLGLPTVPCVVAEHLTPGERRLLRLAINRLGEKGTWNLPELQVELEELVIEGPSIEVIGFDLAEIDGILAIEEPEPLERGPVTPEPGAMAVARTGDVFLLGPHRVICGDARDPTVVADVMSGEMARMIFTDQPYNVAIAGHVTGGAHREFAMASGEMTEQQFSEFNSTWIGAALTHLIEGGIFTTFIDWRGLASVSEAARGAGLSQVNLIVWSKTNAGMGSLYRSQHELLPLFKKGHAPHLNNVDLGRKGRHRSNVWTYPGASTMGSDARRGLQHHPTVKPVAMLADALLDLTARGEIVLDQFLGSGSTLMAAEKTGRVCHGVEFDPLYVDVIVRRYQLATGNTATLARSGETFLEVERRRSQDPKELEGC